MLSKIRSANKLLLISLNSHLIKNYYEHMSFKIIIDTTFFKKINIHTTTLEIPAKAFKYILIKYSHISENDYYTYF